ncbi:DUF1753-domain-containing protein [Sodiomyces alkalinus F11]|uniref:DUF1753-domain-containing protein n=1 Tax=Sodiomyces alkalinus (strain CBS 110278 / VKM F-3762 / F11) TaxID=1314773 RepID=A0A3N2Q531_SODAK|nr:DUF1753-domain-containing protein [Sodiomyces alkalinus F11]ROT41871.1 DUF1753-domain-containing protein [Sodiomyces alkalinus F11]
MTFRGWQLRLPRPKTFLGLISLQTGTEAITLALIINKLTGFYGLLAILTGYSLSLLQLSMYIYSLIVLVLLVVLFPHIRRQSALGCLGLAWLYIIDTVLNAAYTAAFAVEWFAKSSALTREPTEGGDEATAMSPGSLAVPESVMASGTPVVPDVPPSTKHIGPEESWTSLALIVLVTVIRVYLALVVMAFAQQVLSRRWYGAEGWGPDPEEGGGSSSNGSKDGLFVKGTAEGEGWRGRLGRGMLATGRAYWLDERAQEDWAKSMSSKFRSAAAAAHV